MSDIESAVKYANRYTLLNSSLTIVLCEYYYPII